MDTKGNINKPIQHGNKNTNTFVFFCAQNCHNKKKVKYVASNQHLTLVCTLFGRLKDQAFNTVKVDATSCESVGAVSPVVFAESLILTCEDARETGACVSRQFLPCM